MKCQKCQTEHTTVYTFCSKCGTRLRAEALNTSQSSVVKTKVFFFVMLGYIALLNFIPFGGGYIGELTVDAIFATLVTVFLIINYKSMLPLFIPKKINYSFLILLSLGMCAFAFIITHGIDFLFPDNEHNYLENFSNAPFPLLFAIISTGIVPGVFEEIACRGILFNELKNIMSVNATIILTSVLFTILHLSPISFIWIFPIGMFFGYLRSKYDTILYGMVAHFIYNSSIVLIEYFGL